MKFLAYTLPLQRFTLFLFLLLALVQCKKDDAGNANFPDLLILSPANCDTVFTGDFLNFEAEFSGNSPLSAWAIDLHHAFDQHIHQGSDLNCKMSAKKSTINPFIYMQLYDIQANTDSYHAVLQINIPESIDTGDYHVYVRVANEAGYQTNRNVTIKILHKP